MHGQLRTKSRFPPSLAACNNCKSVNMLAPPKSGRHTANNPLCRRLVRDRIIINVNNGFAVILVEPQKYRAMPNRGDRACERTEGLKHLLRAGAARIPVDCSPAAPNVVRCCCADQPYSICYPDLWEGQRVIKMAGWIQQAVAYTLRRKPGEDISFAKKHFSLVIYRSAYPILAFRWQKRAIVRLFHFLTKNDSEPLI